MYVCMHVDSGLCTKYLPSIVEVWFWVGPFTIGECVGCLCVMTRVCAVYDMWTIMGVFSVYVCVHAHVYVCVHEHTCVCVCVCVYLWL